MTGYYRHPTIGGGAVAFVCEDDLWSVAAGGGPALRLTANPGSQSYPRFSPDGGLVAFVGRDEGATDVYLMPATGGAARRLTHFAAAVQVVGWSPDGKDVLVATDWRQPFAGWMHLWRVPRDGSPAEPLRLGPARAVSFAPDGRRMVLGRNSFDPARWKRYRGGRTGSLWVDRRGEGDFEELVRLPGNLADPMWIGRRIYFLSDHEGHGNLYSVTPSGRGLTRHTDHEDFYVRFPSTDGRVVVYQCGADLWVLDTAAGETSRLEITVPSARPQRNRRFLAPGKYLESVDVHPKGTAVSVVARGGTYTMPLWEGAPVSHGVPSRHRRRLAAWLPDGDRVVMVTDEPGEEALEVRDVSGEGEPRVIGGDLGRARSLDVAPAGSSRVALTNHRHEVILVDLGRGTHRVIHQSPHSWIEGTTWSPDGRWLAFSAAVTRTTRNLFLYDTESRRLHQVGRPEFDDHHPSFDPEGRYLAFLSGRRFDPVADAHFHDYGFPWGHGPYLMLLQADARSPFDVAGREPRAPGSPPGAAEPGGEDPAKPGAGKGAQAATAPPSLEIDLEGLTSRVVAVPVNDARYVQVVAGRGRLLLVSVPVTGALGSSWEHREGPRGKLEAWDFGSDKLEQVAEGVSGVSVSADGKVLGIVARPRVRVVPIGWKDDKSGKDAPGRETGWVDLDRIRVEVVPGDEWRQMFREAWRLQRDHFWWPDMGGVDWLEVHDRYLGLVERVTSRAEFSDLLWEMQGELGTSHAYELGGDYRPEPTWSQGSLGADLRFERGRWRVDRIPVGDPWDPKAASPLATPGVDIAEGDRLDAVEGTVLSRTVPPNAALVDRGGRSVTLTVRRGRRRARRVVVTALPSEVALRYRDWVEANRTLVRQLTDGRCGYIHVPDMQAWGFSEFHRSWHQEVDSDGLVIDVRFNRGGNVSQLLLEKLVRKRLGYRITRWRPPYAFPTDAPAGPMVCLTNENAGSDGDIFSHTFKLHGLGPLIGTRTWGGVVGIWPQQSLVDGTITTQPEFGTWFADVGYGVENRGTDPDIEVVITPQDYRVGRDPQILRGVEELLRLVDEAAPSPPDFGAPPSVRAPRLPPG